jgi:hypothetical protein
MPGTATSETEATNISRHGFWRFSEIVNCFCRSRNSHGSRELRLTRFFGSKGRRPTVCTGRT